MQNSMTLKRSSSSAWGSALFVGLATGIATGLFLNSKRGQAMTEEARKRTLQLQKQLMRKLKHVRNLTKEKYEEIVQEIVDHYSATKEVASEQLQDLRASLVDQWDDIRTQLKRT